MQRIKTPLYCLLALLHCVLQTRPCYADKPSETWRVYFVGNSVTDTLNYHAFTELFKARGQTLLWGRHVIPGTPLFLPWKLAESGKESGFVEEPYGNSVNAMRNYVWDAVTLQPFDRHQSDKDDRGYDEGDVASALRYIQAQTGKHPDTQFYIYARWPRMSVDNKSITFDKNAYLDPTRGKEAFPPGLDDWQSLWLRHYTGGWDGTNETKEYFEQLTRDLRKATPGLKKPVLLIPIGHVMYELDRLMKAGKVPGHKTIWEFYNDGIHLDANGSYIVGCTFYAALTKQSPVGLPIAPYHLKDAALARTIQETVWRTVRKHPMAGIVEAK